METLGIADPIDDFSALIEEAVEAHQRNWYEPILDEHHTPMVRVIGSLPVTETAALAKSLIELQALKERVTQPSESVGGAIDVAAISKRVDSSGSTESTTSVPSSTRDSFPGNTHSARQHEGLCDADIPGGFLAQPDRTVRTGAGRR